MDNTYSAKLSDQKIEIPQGLSQAGSDLFAATYATCADWCDEVCSSGNECSMGCTCAGQNNQDPCICSNQGGQCTCSDQGGQSSGSPPTTSGSISVQSVGATSVTLKLSAIPSATSYVVVWRPAATATLAGEKATSSLTVTIDGLQPGTDYVFNYYGENSDGAGPSMQTGAPATTLSGRPEYWSWTDGLVPSKPAVGALSAGDDIPEYLSAAGWTSFIQNIKDVYSYHTGANYSGTLSDGGSGTTKLSAVMVNQAITAIGTMTSSYLPNKTASNVTKLSASLLNGLADSLNSIA